MSRRRVESPRSHRLTDAEKNRPHFVYRLFAVDGTLLYIGVTEDVEHRVYMHRQTTTCVDWLTIWQRYHHHDAAEYPTRLAARAAERAAITEQAPLVNRHHNPKRWRRVGAQYVPVGPLPPAPPLPEPVGPDFGDLLADVLAGIRRAAA